MRKLFFGSIVLTFFAFATTIFQLSCSKTAEGDPTPPVTTLTKEQILVQKTWKVDQLYHVIGGQFSAYLNGGANTTGIPYENLRFTFNANGTGTHIDQSLKSHAMNWQFTSNDQRSLQITIPDFNPSTFSWQMVELAGSYMHASVNLVVNGDDNNLESFRLIQIPQSYK